jgi:hypothetical protein
MIIGISGKKQSGKDTVGRIIQYLTHKGENFKPSFKHFQEGEFLDVIEDYVDTSWEIKKYADKLKDMVCLLIGCTREDLEDENFKNTPLGEEWTRYAYATGFTTDNNGNKSMLSTPCSKEKYEEEYRINWQTAYKRELTPRLLLQLIGTECGRDIIHPNTWVNSLFANWKMLDYRGRPTTDITKECYHPNWIVTDVRFPNEAKAIKQREGILIRLSRNVNDDNHLSETALDDYKGFDFTINNQKGDLEFLYQNVSMILSNKKII